MHECDKNFISFRKKGSNHCFLVNDFFPHLILLLFVNIIFLFLLISCILFCFYSILVFIDTRNVYILIYLL